MRRLDARLGVAVVAIAVAVAVVALNGTAESTVEPHRAEPGSLRFAGVVEQVAPELVVRAEWEWAPEFGEAVDRVTVKLVDDGRPEPPGATPVVGDVVEIAGRRSGDTFLADELIIVDPD